MNSVLHTFWERTATLIIISDAIVPWSYNSVGKCIELVQELGLPWVAGSVHSRTCGKWARLQKIEVWCRLNGTYSLFALVV